MDQLNQSNLSLVQEGVPTPDYDRTKIRAGIVHFGVGAFHRSHQALVIDELLHQGKAFDWGIIGIGVRPEDSGMQRDLRAQDGLYSLTEKHADGSQGIRVIGSIIDMLTVETDGGAAILQLLASPEIRIASLTITEGGYNTHPVTGVFDLSEPAIAADLQQQDSPQTVFGLLVEALRIRRDSNTPAFTVLSCDNLQGNGNIIKNALLTFARAQDPDFADWIAEHVAFPQSMVDRITPATTSADREIIADLLGVYDARPVVSEPFFQWVIEDHFPAGRPAYELTRTQLVTDVEPYERLKLRQLNAAHQGIGHFGTLLGYELVNEATDDPLIRNLLVNYMKEAETTLGPVPGIHIAEYQKTLLSRFGNPAIRDTTLRLATDASDRISKWVVPVIKDRLAAGDDVRYSAAIVAAWAQCARGVDDVGSPIEIVDRLKERILVAAADPDPFTFIRDEELFDDLAQYEEFTSSYIHAHETLASAGARALLTEFLQ